MNFPCCLEVSGGFKNKMLTNTKSVCLGHVGLFYLINHENNCTLSKRIHLNVPSVQILVSMKKALYYETPWYELTCINAVCIISTADLIPISGTVPIAVGFR